MKRLLAVTLGILSAIGGFVDIGDLVANALVGARYGLRLAWVVVLGVVGIIVFAEMSGRIAAVARRPTFDLVRERLGPRTALVGLVGSFLVTALTLCAELGGVALAMELAFNIDYLLLVPLVVVLVWFVIWRIRFERMEQMFGLMGLFLVVYAVALWAMSPDWQALWHQASTPTPPGDEDWPTFLYYGVALFGAAMTPYEVFFFSSGGVEERWGPEDLTTARLNVFVGFPLGGVLSLSIAATAALVFLPRGVEVDTIGQTVLPVAAALGQVGLIAVILGVFAATFGAALETALSSGYTIAQYFGWQWGKMVSPREAPRFHLVVMLTLLVGGMVLLTTVDPVKVTEYSIVFSAMALPLTYVPILIVANDPDYLGDHTNGAVANVLGVFYLVLLSVASVIAVPLMVWTKAGQ
jgi:Mn2+/Fe2+ NRAMP family transporter